MLIREIVSLWKQDKIAFFAVVCAALIGGLFACSVLQMFWRWLCT